jgi:hypothetical protein
MQQLSAKERAKAEKYQMVMERKLTHNRDNMQAMRQQVKHLKTEMSALQIAAKVKARAVHRALRICKKVKTDHLAAKITAKALQKYKTANVALRQALAQSTEKALTAAKVTQAASDRATSISQHSLMDRTNDQRLFKQEKALLKEQQAEQLKALKKAKATLSKEHHLRILSEDSRQRSSKAIKEAKAAADIEHNHFLKAEQEAKEAKDEQVKLQKQMQRQRSMIEMQQDAVTEAKQSVHTAEVAGKEKIHAVKAKYHKLLQTIHNEAALIAEPRHDARDKQHSVHGTRAPHVKKTAQKSEPSSPSHLTQLKTRLRKRKRKSDAELHEEDRQSMIQTHAEVKHVDVDQHMHRDHDTEADSSLADYEATQKLLDAVIDA